MISAKQAPASPSEHGGGDRCESCKGRGTVSPYGTPQTEDRHSIKCNACGGTGQAPGKEKP